MKKQAPNHVNRKLSESGGAPAKPTSAVSGEFVTEMFEYDGGRQVTVYVPPDLPEAIVFATAVPVSAPTKFAVADIRIACDGRRARVETEVAMAFAVSWNPLM